MYVKNFVALIRNVSEANLTNFDELREKVYCAPKCRATYSSDIERFVRPFFVQYLSVQGIFIPFFENKPIHKIPSKSDNGKVVKYTGKIFWGKITQGGGKFGGRISKKKWKPTNFHPKMNTCMKFHPNQKMGKWSNLGGKFSGGEFHRWGGNLGGEFWKKNENLQNAIAK